MIRKVVLLVAILGLGAPAVAQTPPAAATVASDPLRPRAQALLGILGGGGDTAAEFDPTFLAQIPDAKIRTIAKQLSDAFGAPLAIESLTATTPQKASLTVRYARGSVAMTMTVEPSAAHRITGLLVTGTTSGEASLDQILKAVRLG